MTYNNNKEEELVQLLIDVGALTAKDVVNIQTVQHDVILGLLLKKGILKDSEQQKVKILLKTMLSTNKTQRLHAKMAFIDLVTFNLHHRIAKAVGRITNHKTYILNQLANTNEIV